MYIQEACHGRLVDGLLYLRCHDLYPDSWFHTRGRRRWQGQKPLIFMRFHGRSLGNQHEICSKQHNGKVRSIRTVERMPVAQTSLRGIELA
jgi:hypothetical protein